jgi:hypothetical protein
MSEAVLNGTQVTIANKSTELKQSLAAEMLKVNKSLDFDKSMDEIETMECLQMLLRDFYYLKYEEFVLVFRMMREGKFGTFYNRLKMADYNRCFVDYDKSESRSFLFEKHNNNLQKSNNLNTLHGIDYDKVRERLKAEREVKKKEVDRADELNKVIIDYKFNGRIEGTKDETIKSE